MLTKGILPFWHYLDGSFNDEMVSRLLGRDVNTSFTDYEPLLVIDGAFTDQGTVKQEKLRDIINLSSNHAVFLLLGGKDPFIYCSDKLGFEPKKMVVFGTHRERQIL